MRNQSIAKIVVGDDLATFSKFWPNSYSTTSARRYAFQCADILDIWCQTIGRARKLSPFFVAISDYDGALLLLLPLVVVKSKGLRILRFVDEGVSDLNAPVVFPGARNWNQSIVQSLWTELKRQLPPFDLALFDKMPELVEDWPNPLRFLRTATGQYGSYKTKLPTDWDRDAKQRLPDYADSRRRIRNLSKLGSVSFFIPQTNEEALAVLSALLELKSQKFIQTKGRDSFITEPGYRDYYVEATKQLFGVGSVHIAALKLESTILAAHFGYVVGERFYALVTGFKNEPEWTLVIGVVFTAFEVVLPGTTRQVSAGSGALGRHRRRLGIHQPVTGGNRVRQVQRYVLVAAHGHGDPALRIRRIRFGQALLGDHQNAARFRQPHRRPQTGNPTTHYQKIHSAHP